MTLALIEDLERIQTAVNATSGTDLHHDPPATIRELERCESLLGLELPHNLRQVYQFANGGRTLFIDYWSSVERLPAFHARHMDFVIEERANRGRGPEPTSPWVSFLGISPADVVVECGDNGDGGRVWFYFAGESRPWWVEAAPSLEAFVAAHADLAEAGLIEARQDLGSSHFTIRYARNQQTKDYRTSAGLAILERHHVNLP